MDNRYQLCHDIPINKLRDNNFEKFYIKTIKIYINNNFVFAWSEKQLTHINTSSFFFDSSATVYLNTPRFYCLFR